MGNVEVYTLLRPELHKETVFGLLRCKEQDPARMQMEQAYMRLLPEVVKNAKPRAALALSVIGEREACKALPEGSRVLYVVQTIGTELGDLSDRFFQTRNYVDGLVLDAMADSCLFALDQAVTERIRNRCRKDGLGVLARLSPSVEIPLSFQRKAFEETQAAEKLGIGITVADMLDPAKSSSNVYLLSSNPDVMRVEHDCRTCTMKECVLRKD
ncbi:MAG: hypothetical protein K5682_08220 [Lachnospiraceae bacterium]|nr:hypothetical protein [Lachnospiraceae bacterium]